jgi:peptidoglycan/xylan/chitin deacetylase (PgdA/CDA1 family)
MKNRYFEETQGVSVHPRMLTREEKENLENKYSSEYSVIIAILQQANSSRHRFVVKSAELSNEMTARALGALKKKNIKEAIEDCKTAIDIFPLNAKPYILLTKFYLMTGQEQKMFETLTLAGHSYPNFDSIVGIINDGDLEKMPLDAPQDNIFLANFPENKKTAISFIFDDGEKNVYTNAVPVFEKNGFRATFAVIAGMVAATDDDLFWGSWSEWKDAADRGFEIANHSMYHRNASELHGSDFDIAIDQSKALIEKNIGHQVTAYIFPYDGYNDEAVSRALREHKVVRSWELLRACYNRTVGITYGGPNFSVDTANRLVDIGIKRQLWLVANCHGVTTKRGILSFKSMTPDFLEKHLAYIHDRSNDVWVDTFSNVFAYLSQRAQTTIEIKGFTVGWAEFILHNANAQIKLSCPITVVLKTPQGVKIKSVHTSDDHMLKAWVCAADKLCVDADLYDEDIRVQWE